MEPHREQRGTLVKLKESLDQSPDPQDEPPQIVQPDELMSLKNK